MSVMTCHYGCRNDTTYPTERRLQEMREKTLQIRLDNDEYQKIKFAFKDENLSQLVRCFLIKEANERLGSDDMSLRLQEDKELQSFLCLLNHPEVQKTLFSLFKKAKEV